MRIENENFVLVSSLNTLSLVYMTEYYNNKKQMIHTSMFQKHIHKVKFYPSADDLTQAPLVMLVTNIMSDLEEATRVLKNGLERSAALVDYKLGALSSNMTSEFNLICNSVERTSVIRNEQRFGRLQAKIVNRQVFEGLGSQLW